MPCVCMHVLVSEAMRIRVVRHASITRIVRKQGQVKDADGRETKTGGCGKTMAQD